MTQGSNELHFFYDAQNRPAVVVYNGTAYAYVKSLQGDIVAILDENGNAVVSYGYDAWGAPLWCTGELAETLGKVQPFRYRGYVFDEETGLYYLRSRYYNPGWGRFVNADNIVTRNLFLYCNNSCISNSDPDGYFLKNICESILNNVKEKSCELIQQVTKAMRTDIKNGYFYLAGSKMKLENPLAPHELLIGPPAKVVATGVANIDIFSWERFWEKMFGYSMDSQGFLNVIKDANFSLELQINTLQIGNLPYTASAVVIFKTNDTLLNYGVSIQNVQNSYPIRIIDRDDNGVMLEVDADRSTGYGIDNAETGYIRQLLDRIEWRWFK